MHEEPTDAMFVEVVDDASIHYAHHRASQREAQERLGVFTQDDRIGYGLAADFVAGQTPLASYGDDSEEKIAERLLDALRMSLHEGQNPASRWQLKSWIASYVALMGIDGWLRVRSMIRRSCATKSESPAEAFFDAELKIFCSNWLPREIFADPVFQRLMCLHPRSGNLPQADRHSPLPTTTQNLRLAERLLSPPRSAPAGTSLTRQEVQGQLADHHAQLCSKLSNTLGLTPPRSMGSATPCKFERAYRSAGITDREIIHSLHHLQLIDADRHEALLRIWHGDRRTHKDSFSSIFAILQEARVATLGDHIIEGYKIHRAANGLNAMRWLSKKLFNPTCFFDRFESKRLLGENRVAYEWNETTVVAFIHQNRLFRGCQCNGYRDIGKLLINLGTFALREAKDPRSFASWKQSDEYECKGSYLGYLFGEEHSLRRFVSESKFDHFFEVQWPDPSLWRAFQPGELANWIARNEERAFEFKTWTGYDHLLYEGDDSVEDGTVVWYE